MDLQERAFALARHLHDEHILNIDDLEQLKNNTYEEIECLADKIKTHDEKRSFCKWFPG